MTEVPDHVDVRATVASWAGEGATATARIRLRRDAGYPLRAKAIAVTPVDADWDELEIPYGRGDVVAAIHREGEVLVEVHDEAGTRVRARVPHLDLARFEPFVVRNGARP